MGTYLNPGKNAFEEAFHSEIFIDKSEMILYMNKVVRTKQKYVCVSRPRRFGKTMAGDMICAYYDREADSKELFEMCIISSVDANHDSKSDHEGHANRQSKAGIGSKANIESKNWDAYLGKFDVIRLVMTDFFKKGVLIDDALKKLQKLVVRDLIKVYPEVDFFDKADLLQSMQDIYAERKTQFVIVIDEWDAIFREYPEDREGQKKYLDFLRDWMKDKEYIALAYMTGILPIKKYGKHSALNMFTEYSMTQPRQMAEYMGFTRQEVEGECLERKLDYSGFKSWYDGYRLSNKASEEMIPEGEQVDTSLYREYEIYSPYSVVNAIISKQFGNYWNQTETYEAGLAYAVQLAYYAAQDYYTIVPELDTGKGYADLVFIPVKPDIPAMLIEFKYEKDANTAIAQIHRQKYPDRLELYKGNLILVGINYDRNVSNESVEFKHHSCEIERA